MRYLLALMFISSLAISQESIPLSKERRQQQEKAKIEQQNQPHRYELERQQRENERLHANRLQAEKIHAKTPEAKQAVMAKIEKSKEKKLEIAMPFILLGTLASTKVSYAILLDSKQSVYNVEIGTVLNSTYTINKIEGRFITYSDLTNDNYLIYNGLSNGERVKIRPTN